MSGYSFEKSFPVLYGDCNHKDEIRPSALLSFAQEVAGQSADELGFGYNDTIGDRCGFFITTTCCEMISPIRVGDVLKVSTWPLTPRHCIFERDYSVGRGEETVALLTSRWCLVDLDTNKLLPPERLKAHANCPYRDERVMSPDWSLPKLRGEGKEVYSMQARLSHCDHFRHVNNTKYADFFMDCFSEEELEEKRVKSFRISYVKQVKAGEKLTFYRMDTEEGTALEARVNGEATTRFFVSFNRTDEEKQELKCAR